MFIVVPMCRKPIIKLNCIKPKKIKMIEKKEYKRDYIS